MSYTVKKGYRYSHPQYYSRPERVWLVTSQLGTGKTITFFYSVPPQKAKKDAKSSFFCAADDHTVGGALPAGPHTHRPDGERLHHHRRRHGAMRHRLRTLH
jgi:hypothetical protein